jgi:hypothetical protein
MMFLLLGFGCVDNNKATINYSYTKNLPNKIKDAGMFADYLNKHCRYDKESKYLATAWVNFKKEHPEVKTSFKTVTKYLNFEKVKISEPTSNVSNDDTFFYVWMFIIMNDDGPINQSLQEEETESLSELESTGIEQSESTVESESDAETDASDAGESDASGDGGDGGGD